jgi:uncharacterized protein YwqG
VPRNTHTCITILVCLLALSGCGDRPADQVRSYDELEPYYSGEVVADYPEEMAEYRSAFDASGLPFAKAEGKIGSTSVYDSKLLGVPYMPRGFVYPRDPDEKPLQLLAQINFADVPPLPDYPDNGILQFYISDDLDTSKQVWGLQFYDKRPYDPHSQFELMQSQDYFRVVWHETILTDEDALEHRVPTGSEGIMPVDDEAKLSFHSGTSFPGPVDYRFGRIFGADAYEFFEQFGESEESVATRYYSHITVREIAWVGGYAEFTQSDPREIVPEEDWLLLLEIQSSMTENQPSVLWGDAGIGAFFIKPEDLRNRDFSRVLYTWDNH